MKLIYNDVDITDQTRILRCEINQYLEGHIDTMTISFDNSQNLWTGWNPARGDRIRMSEGYVDSGEMVVVSIRSEDHNMVLDAAPMLNIQDGQIKAWKKPSFGQLARSIAGRLGLELAMYGVKDQKYEGIEQKGESDLIFLSNLCKLEGCSFIVSDGKLMIMSMDYLDSIPVSEYVINASSYRLHNDEYYSGCEVTDGKTTGKAGDSKGESYCFQTDRKLESIGQANRFAGNMLRYANKDRKGGNLTADSLLEYAMPGSKIKITCEYWTEKPAMITRARYDIIRNRTKLWFRLEENDG